MPGILSNIILVWDAIAINQPTIQFSICDIFRRQGGGLALKQKDLSQGRGLCPFVIVTSWSLSGWLWHLTGAGCRAGHRASSLPPLFMNFNLLMPHRQQKKKLKFFY